MEDSSKNKILWIVVMILIIVIIILLCLSKCEKKEDKYQVHTGNSDVFNIDIKCDNNTCSVENDNKDNNIENNKNITKTNTDNKKSQNKGEIQTGNDTKNNEETKPTYNEISDSNVLDKVFVDDKSGNYVYQQRLNIFNNAAFQYTNKIAPGVSNTYEFKANNTSNKSIKYYVEMYEESEYDINLKYRLKRNGTYIVGNDDNWVDVDELKTTIKTLDGNSSDTYSLDWKWFDDDTNDTIIGENMTSEYKLNIRFYFETID